MAGADERTPPDGAGRGEQTIVERLTHRHHAPVHAAHFDEHAARAADDVGASHRAKLSPDEPGSRAEAYKGGGPAPADHGGLGVGQGQVAGDLGVGVGRLGPLASSGVRVDGPVATEAARKRRLVRTVRLVAGEQAAMEVAQRSITDG